MSRYVYCLMAGNTVAASFSSITPAARALPMFAPGAHLEIKKVALPVSNATKARRGIAIVMLKPGDFRL